MTRIIYDTSEETRVREIARLREKALHDEASALKHAKDAATEEGRAEERNSIMKKMKAMGMDEEQINQILGYEK